MATPPNLAMLGAMNQDTEYLLCHLLRVNRAQLHAQWPPKLTARMAKQLATLERARSRGAPLQYLVGSAWFYSLKFFVSRNVLIPRPETELIVERALAHTAHTLIDVGTGSGAIAIAYKKNIPTARVIACDVSARALAVARRNAITNRTHIQFFKSDLLKNIQWPRTARIIVTANLPYLSDAQMKRLTREVKKEPRRALYGGSDGLDLYRALVRQIKTRISPRQKIVLLAELEPTQKTKFAALVRREFPHATTTFHRDLHDDTRCAEVIL